MTKQSVLEMQLCSHVIKYDGGLAPNPFYGFCTTALCTPSHTRAKLKEGDWLIGVSPKADGNKLVYAMRISQTLSMNEYFHDARFESKKPKMDGTAIEQCGDNIYYQRGTKWTRLPSPFHNDPHDFSKDAGCHVFVAEHFYYFGDKRVTLPDYLKGVIQDRHGISYKNDLAGRFVSWLEANYKPGRIGEPHDLKRHQTRGRCR
jgi:Nucleotide modification associated domain 2